MTMRSKLAAAMPFAHLMGLATAQGRAKGKVTGRRAEEDDDREAEEEEDAEPKSRKAKGKGGRAEDDDAKPDAEGDDPDAKDDEDEDEDEDPPKSRKAKGKRAAEDEDDERAEEDDTAARRAVKADRQRCAAIVAHGFANGCAEQACVFAFDTNMSKSAAINALTAGSKAGGKAKGSSLAERMDAARVKPVGSDGGGDAPAGMSANAAAIIRAAEAAGGRR